MSRTTWASWLQRHLDGSFWAGGGVCLAQDDEELGVGIFWIQQPFSKCPGWESRSQVPGSGWREME